MSDLTALDVSTFLKPGVRYTITINEPVLGTGTSVQDVLTHLQGIGTMSQISLVRIGWNWDVTFTYIGDGSDVVADLFQSIADNLDAWYGSWEYVGAYASATGAADSHNKLNPNIPLPTTGWLWAVVAVLVVIVFIASGGIGVARTVTRAAA